MRSFFRFDTFRNRLLFLFSSISFVLVVSASFFIERVASDQMTQVSGHTLFLATKSISNTLATSLNEREREIVLLSQSPFLAEADFKHPNVQQQLNQVKNSYQYYAWIGISSPKGNVEVASDQLLLNADVSDRPWFIAGLKETHLGDVHQAKLLANKIKPIDADEPLRFIDFATPIYDPKTNKLKGVLAAHADWSWAKSVMHSAFTESAKKRNVEVFIVNARGEILYPLNSVGKIKPPSFDQNRKEYFIDDWDEERNYLTVHRPVVSDTHVNLGWQVIMRQPVEIALSEVKAMQKKIVIFGLFFSLILLMITYRLANRFSTPIEDLAKSAYAVQKGMTQVNFEQKTNIREIKGLSESLKSMTDTLLLQKKQLVEANLNLEERVQARTYELELANDELEKLTRYDFLTGLHNRREYSEFIEYLYMQFKRNHQIYSVLMMDIDYFKKVNDNFGHDMGDHVLKSVAQILKQSIRVTDFVARLGGEEFIIILPTTTLNGAVLVAEKVRQSIERATIIENYTLTISIGISIASEQDTQATDVVRRADQCLYLAKEQGRNRIVSQI